MTSSGEDRRFILPMVRHLPPAGASLRLLDMGGRAGGVLQEWRPDVELVSLTLGAESSLEPDSADAVVALNPSAEQDLLGFALMVLRPGGRLIAVDPAGHPSQALVRVLEAAGFTRILVEPLAAGTGAGVLMRGEKPHTEAHTMDRVRAVAARDAQTAGGRYIHLLIRQTPNKPVWALESDEPVEWHAVAVEGQDEVVALAFSSLPRAVEFMQPVVLAGQVREVTKIAKFRLETARDWPFPIMLNPTSDIFETNRLALVPVDPASAETPDE